MAGARTKDPAPQGAPYSRRAMLLGTVGGLVALAAPNLGRPEAARAANGDAVTVGGSFSGTAATAISRTGATNFTHSTIHGTSDGGTGVGGSSSTSLGVWLEHLRHRRGWRDVFRHRGCGRKPRHERSRRNRVCRCPLGIDLWSQGQCQQSFGRWRPFHGPHGRSRPPGSRPREVQSKRQDTHHGRPRQEDDLAGRGDQLQPRLRSAPHEPQRSVGQGRRACSRRLHDLSERESRVERLRRVVRLELGRSSRRRTRSFTCRHEGRFAESHLS